jgi:hypothetical protein
MRKQEVAFQEFMKMHGERILPFRKWELASEL